MELKIKPNELHEPVMVEEVLEALHIENQAQITGKPRYIDATLGTGGHTEEILKKGGNVLGVEFDPHILEIAKERLEKEPKYKEKFKLIRGNFKDIEKLAKNEGFDDINGIIFDLGVSNLHLGSGVRGFSFGNPDAPLDMRINPAEQGVSASDLLNLLREDQLRDLFEMTMNPHDARFLVKKIIKKREESPFSKVGDFLEILGVRRERIHPATKPFLALRIAVNSELENLRDALPQAFNLLSKNGRLLVVSFHSLEDKIAKDFFKEFEETGKGRIIIPFPVFPSPGEVLRNPRSRSAKLRIIEKI